MSAISLTTDVLVVGAGGAGMTAALSAAQAGAQVLLVDRNMVGRGGATIMAQMTVAAALSEQEADSWEDHLADTITAGRGLCDAALAELVCRLAPARMRQMDAWGVGWARTENHISQVMAPGHRVARCCYVDFLNTGPAVAQTLRKQVGKQSMIRRVSDLLITELICSSDGQVCGAFALNGKTGSLVTIEAASIVIATGGLTRLYSRSSASGNMAGEGYALGLRAGARLVDMEFVQFFPIGHLAPRLVGMDPIMWDPFRYKLGGRLLNSAGEEFMDAYGSKEDGHYTATRDLATYAIHKEVQAGRGSPHGGAFLSFRHLDPAALRTAFGPIIDRLANNGIDLANQDIEVSPIAHYHMGGLKVDPKMKTTVPGLFAAGEAVGGASGANRLSGNAISEALVFGDIAGEQAAIFAAAQAKRIPIPHNAKAPAPQTGARDESQSAANMMQELKTLMWEKVGPFRTRSGLEQALTRIEQLQTALHNLRLPDDDIFPNRLFDWHEMRAALLVSDSVARAALQREESRGAHQREDFIQTDSRLEKSQLVSFVNGVSKVTYEAN
ncbi:MAG: FAD-dependent oxidoreductase [Burkholderiaceae bacterium]